MLINPVPSEILGLDDFGSQKRDNDRIDLD